MIASSDYVRLFYQHEVHGYGVYSTPVEPSEAAMAVNIGVIVMLCSFIDQNVQAPSNIIKRVV
jgi:hypothetical protein